MPDIRDLGWMGGAAPTCQIAERLEVTVQVEVENEQDPLWICHCERSEAIPQMQLLSTVEIASSLHSSQ